jgi:hypothetical protein
MEQALAYSLSDEDLRRLNPHTHLYLYEDVKKFNKETKSEEPDDSLFVARYDSIITNKNRSSDKKR